eukprot:c12334_g2_i3.p1 GENE.c12334_g2_i3~~c12334_g2_i3.p1  ORF type:complete len:389 (-),score=100.35 c12334_g2_i3:498-1664(-)
MLTLEVNPAHSLGPFVLGMSVGECLDFLRAPPNSSDFPVIDVKYNEQEVYNHPIVLDLVENGISLQFDAVSQLLVLMIVHSPALIKLSYRSIVFNAPNVQPAFGTICPQLFGMTQSGEWSSTTTSSSYLLKYPGISFRFEIPTEFRNAFKEDLPIELPDGSSPIASRIEIHPAPHVFASRTHALHPITHLPNIVAKVDEGLEVDHTLIALGSPFQDILHVLGTPSHTHFKHSDQMLIHVAQEATACNHVIHSYKHAGIDVVVDVIDNTIKKFVLHTNIPGHVHFQIYHKCPFTISVKQKRDDSSKVPEASSNSASSGSDVPDVLTIPPEAPWSDIVSRVGVSDDQPLINNHGRGLSPFGPTYFHGFSNHKIVFEVTKPGYVATVILFE